MGKWTDSEEWGKLLSGDGCPICLEGKPPGAIAELETGYLTTQPEQPLHGYCCLVLRRHAVELQDLEIAEAEGFMRDMRAVSGALQGVTGAVKMNVEIHGNTIPHLHAHFFPRYAGDRFEGGPIDPQGTEPIRLRPDEFEVFVAGLRAALEEV
ncbi:HIT domain-containing protein [Rubrobacter tropicus]|uniref:HIT domain-containing protein n=1 Tax=Rubrobacter tropicus TaxID=2653851 RepID=A0A6G8Q7D7_9ACTN|nr:HIT family protein [Rubrobacter tropicus]QIN82386.1 HIT domain-containing protein [Rubrobacter tropicus]